MAVLITVNAIKGKGVDGVKTVADAVEVSINPAFMSQLKAATSPSGINASFYYQGPTDGFGCTYEVTETVATILTDANA